MLKFLVNSLSWILGLCFGALLFLVLGYFVYTYAMRGFEIGSEFAYNLTMEIDNYEIEFVIDDYTPLAEVAQMLEDMYIVPSALLYRLEMTLMGHTTDYVPGTFLLDKSLSSSQINARLRARPVDPQGEENRIMIREGWTQQDIADYMEFRGFFTAEEFMYVANNHDFGFHFLNDIPHRQRSSDAVPSRLEGYLFPDTYFVSANPTPVEVIMNMLTRFNQVFNFEYRMRAEDIGRSMDEIVIIASMIEREVRYAPERPMVARVIYNRLAQGMPLQIDATVLYAMNIHLYRLLYVHLSYDSPFNTYVVSGLPIGPIGNPSAASIQAALFPADGDWLFYVLVDAETGRHGFTNNYAEHRRLRDTYMPRPWDAAE